MIIGMSNSSQFLITWNYVRGGGLEFYVDGCGVVRREVGTNQLWVVWVSTKNNNNKLIAIYKDEL